MNFEEIIIESLSNITGMSADELRKNKSLNLFEYGVLDSLSLISLVDEVEKKTNLKIDISKCDINDFTDINSFINFINSNAKKRVSIFNFSRR